MRGSQFRQLMGHDNWLLISAFCVFHRGGAGPLDKRSSRLKDCLFGVVWRGQLARIDFFPFQIYFSRSIFASHYGVI